MRISLITASYNSAKTISTTVESVMRQKNADIEYLLIDGGSTDGTTEIAAKLLSGASFQYKIVSEPDNGLYDAINKGIALASGEVVGILNSDDVFASDDVLESISRGFDGKTDAVFADVLFVRPSGGSLTLREVRALPAVRYYSSKFWRPWMHNWGFMPAHPSFYARRSLFRKLGLYRTGYLISADFELMVRFLCREKVAYRYLPVPVAIMRTGGMSTSGVKSNILLNRENVRANRENGYFSHFVMMLPKYAFKIWQYVFR